MARPFSGLHRWLPLVAVALALVAAWSMFAGDSSPGQAVASVERPFRSRSAPRTARGTASWEEDVRATEADRSVVCGAIVDDTTEAPIPGAVVSLRPRTARGANAMLVPGGGRRSWVAPADPSGQWRFLDVPLSASKTWSVAVTAEGYRPQVVTGSGSCEGNSLTVRLESGGVVLHGTVRDATGGALAGATVHVGAGDPFANGAEFDASLSTIAGEDGEYRISVEPGVHNVVARFPDYAEDRRWVRVEATTQRDFALLPGGRIEGTVVRGADGNAVAFARVSMTPRGGQPTTGGEAAATTDVAGRFVIEGIEPGELELHAYAESGRTSSGTVLELGPGGYRTGVELRLEAAPAAYGVVVLRSDPSVAVEGATVLAQSGAAAWVSEPTDTSGGFVLPALAPGEYQLSVDAPGYIPNNLAATLRVADGDVEGLVLEVEAGTTVFGQVVEGGSDTSVRVEVDLEGLPPAQGMPRIGNAFVSTRCDAEGRFELGPVTTGELTLVAEDPTRGTGRAQTTASQDGDPPVLIELSAATGLEGRVFGTDGPREGLRIAAVRLDRPASVVPPTARVSASQASVRTKADGSFRHAGLEPGTYLVQVLDASSVLAVEGEPPVVAVVADTWASTRIELADPSGVLTGQVINADGSPVADAVVRASLPSLSTERTLTDEDGAFEFGGLPVGEGIRLRVTDASPGGTFVDEEAQVGDDVRVQMPRGATLTVMTRDLGVGRLSLSGTSSAQHSMRSNGAAQFVRLPEGKYRLEARGEDGHATTTFELDGSDMSIELTGEAWATVEGTLHADLVEVGEGRRWMVFAADSKGQLRGHDVQRALLGHGARTTADGAFVVSRVAPGPGQLTITPPNEAAGEPITVSIDPKPGQTLDLGEVGSPQAPT